MSEKIEDGTILYCDYLHLDSADELRVIPKGEKGDALWKEWKIESKERTVLILYECGKENLRYRSYVILKLTTVKETAKRNGYFKIGKYLEKEMSYARSYPETYPENLLRQNKRTDKINKELTLDTIMKKMTLPKIGYPLRRISAETESAH